MFRIRPLFLTFVYLVTVVSVAGFSIQSDFDFWTFLDRYGFPTAFCLLLWWWFSRQNEKRYQELKEFWDKNNDYLKKLLDESRNQSVCKYNKNDSSSLL